MPRTRLQPRYYADRAGAHAEYIHRRRWLWITLASGVMVLGGLGLVGYIFAMQALSVKDDLTAAKEELKSITGYVKSGDTAALDDVAKRALAHTSRAQDTVQGPLWGLAAQMPVFGQNISAVQDATQATDILVRDAVPVGVKMLTAMDLKNMKMEGGGINLTPFTEVQKDLPAINSAFERAQQKVAHIDRSKLLPVVDTSIGQLLSVIDQATPALKTVQSVLPTLLDVAGAHGARTYLVIFQNNAEIRATGGNPAASMILTVDNGKVAMMDQASSATFYAAGKQDSAYTKLPAETLALYPKTMSRHSQDFTMTPDFPTTAELFQNLWQHTNGSRFDGVISIDPKVLAETLSVAGPFVAADGTTISSDNAVKVLLSDAYARYPKGTDSDIFFADVAGRAFTHLMTPTWDPLKMLAVLQTASAEQRIHLSFNRPEEQALAVDYGLDGALRADTKTKTQLGIYLNDYSVGKLEYYLKTAVSATCNAEQRTATVTMTMQNSVPSSELTAYVLGARNGNFGFSNRAMMLDVLFFAPPGAKIVETQPSKGDVGALARSGVDKGNTALSKLVALQPGSTRTVSYTVQFPAGSLGELELRHTPTANDTPVTIAPECGSLFPSK